MANGKQNGERKDEEQRQQAGPAPEAKVPESEYNELKDRMLRLAAEFDNYKKRVRGDIDSAKAMGKYEFLKGMLPVLDEFELALVAASKSDDKAMLKGMEMLYSNLLETLRREGLTEVKVDGVFDPYKHEILMVRESDRKDGTILEVIKKGYTFNQMLLRPAAVIIAKGQEKKQEQEKDAEEE